MFGLRGERKPPNEVVIINLDRESAEKLKLPGAESEVDWLSDPWPRSLHTKLIHKLTKAGAQVIVFDIFFKARGQIATEDSKLADAIRLAGNVVIVFRLNQNKDGTIVARRPQQLLVDSAAGTAPFVLPRESKISQCWLFIRGDKGAYIPTIPALALQIFARDAQVELLHDPLIQPLVNGLTLNNASNTAKYLWHSLQEQPQIVQRLHQQWSNSKRVTANQRNLALALLDLYSGTRDRLLDFYGKPKSIKTIPYHQALYSENDQDFRGKAVFIGFTPQTQSEYDKIRDDYNTVFSHKDDGLQISGVEIAATAFANLLEHRHARMLPLIHQLVIVTMWGIVLGIACIYLPVYGLIPAVLLLAGGYLGGAVVTFTRTGLWLPLVTPLLLQPMVTLLTALLWHYRDAQHERERIRRIIRHYVPEFVINQLIRNKRLIAVTGEECYGICLHSDAAKFTGRSELMDPLQLHQMLNHYYQLLFKPISRYGGFVSDVVGDAMLAIWRARAADEPVETKACLAALEITEQLLRADFGGTGKPLPTRIGLHCGKFSLGHLGAEGHFEFRAVGDVVNSSQRIEQLNKLLGTQILASQAVVEQLSGIVTRRVGRFRLRGKSIPLDIYELLCREEDYNQSVIERCEKYEHAKQLFDARHWSEAAEVFRWIIARFGSDGPSLYYLRWCERFVQEPPAPDWDGVIVLD